MTAPALAPGRQCRDPCTGGGRGHVADDVGAFQRHRRGDWSAFTTGSVDVALAAGAQLLSIDKMAPGDTAYRSLTVKNPGSLEFPVTRPPSRGPTRRPKVPLSDVLLLSTYALPAGAECSATAEQGVDVRPAETMAAHGAALFGDAATGSQPGGPHDPRRWRRSAVLPHPAAGDAGADYRDSTSTVSIQVSAEQTANNP